jgi:hypothetical protein
VNGGIGGLGGGLSGFGIHDEYFVSESGIALSAQSGGT